MTEQFQRLGMLGTWDTPYLTMDFRYQAAIARTFGRFVEKGLVYKGKKPVHWCIHCRTALAEAEVEYADHVSPSIYVEFPLAPESPTELVVARSGACRPRRVGRHLDDDALDDSVESRHRVSSRVRLRRIRRRRARRHHGRGARAASGRGDGTHASVHPIAKMKGSSSRASASAIRCTRAIRSACWPTTSRSTPAPAPFTRRPATAPTTSPPARNTGSRSTRRSGPGGHFLDTVELFAGQRVLDANANVEQELKQRSRLLHRSNFSHQYPHCWRCHNPVIFLATSQWFIRMDGEPVIAADGEQPQTLRKAALHAIDTRRQMDSGVGTRPDLQHGVEPARLVHLAAARLGCADSGGRLHEVRRGDHDAGARRERGEGVRSAWRRRVVRAARRRVSSGGAGVPEMRRNRRSRRR